jgi:putative SOS response-associated peptidase YedK
MFATSFARRRCLVPADGWYEWARRGSAGKQPYFMARRDGGVVGFAGVWSLWRSGDEQRLTCSVLTTAAVGDLALVHDRMPLVLPEARWAGWLDHDLAVDAERLLSPVPDDVIAGIELRPVGPEVGDVRNDGPQLLRRVPADPLGRPGDERADLTLF